MKPQPQCAARVLLAAAALACAVPAFAGTGRVRASGGGQVLDFCVSVRFAATPAELANIQRALTDAGEVLADATDGQYAFGRVDIVTDSGAGLEAEVWIKSEAGSAYARLACIERCDRLSAQATPEAAEARALATAITGDPQKWRRVVEQLESDLAAARREIPAPPAP